MPKGDAYVLMYAAGICLASSLLLAATSAGLKKQQDKMIELDRKFNVLKAFQVQVTDAKNRRIPGDEIEKVYGAHVREAFLDAKDGTELKGRTLKDIPAASLASKAVLPLFEWEEDGKIAKYAFPVSGKGLWSTIYGYLALNHSLDRIVGITFYKHGETPGLGGEVEQPWFQKQFQDRPVFANGRLKRIEVAKGKATAPSTPEHEAVDGISGATLTGNGVTRFLNEDLALYEKHFKGLRKE